MAQLGQSLLRYQPVCLWYHYTEVFSKTCNYCFHKTSVYIFIARKKKSTKKLRKICGDIKSYHPLRTWSHVTRLCSCRKFMICKRNTTFTHFRSHFFATKVVCFSVVPSPSWGDSENASFGGYQNVQNEHETTAELLYWQFGIYWTHDSHALSARGKQSHKTQEWPQEIVPKLWNKKRLAANLSVQLVNTNFNTQNFAQPLVLLSSDLFTDIFFFRPPARNIANKCFWTQWWLHFNAEQLHLEEQRRVRWDCENSQGAFQIVNCSISRPISTYLSQRALSDEPENVCCRSAVKCFIKFITTEKDICRRRQLSHTHSLEDKSTWPCSQSSSGNAEENGQLELTQLFVTIFSTKT